MRVVFYTNILWQGLVKESVCFTYSRHLSSYCFVDSVFIPSANLFHTTSPQGAHLLRNRESLITSATWLVSQCVWVGVCLFVLRVLGETVHVCSVHCVGLFFLLDVTNSWLSHSWSTFYLYNYRRNVEESVALGQTVLSIRGFVCVHVFGSFRCPTQFSKSDAYHNLMFFLKNWTTRNLVGRLFLRLLSQHQFVVPMWHTFFQYGASLFRKTHVSYRQWKHFPLQCSQKPLPP